MRLTQAPTARADYFDRNPTIITTCTFINLALAPAGNTNRCQYQPPAGRKAQVAILNAYMRRNTVAAPIGLWRARAQINGTVDLIYLGNTVNTVDTRDNAVVKGDGIITALETLAFFTQDSSTGGDVSYVFGAHIIEFDA